jgi:hypothetical protein
MRLAAIIAVFAILLVFAVSLFVGLTASYQNAPRFEQVRTPSTVSAVSYDFLSSRPFEAGMMNVTASTGATNGGVFIYDIDHRRVLGLLSNGSPVMLFGRPLQVVCCQPAPVVAPINFRERWLNLLARISRGRIQAPARESGQTYWTLNLANNTARLLRSRRRNQSRIDVTVPTWGCGARSNNPLCRQ